MRPQLNAGHFLIRKARGLVAKYVDRPALLPTLARVDRNGQPRERHQYEQRRRACVVVLDRLLQHLDLVTLRVGVNGANVLGIKLSTIAEDSGLDDRRIDRAIRDLRDSGILTSYRRADQQAGGFIGRTSVRRLAAELFGALGLGAKLAKVRQRLSQARREPARDPRATANAGLALNARKARQAPAATDQTHAGRLALHRQLIEAAARATRT